jgi:hypothetical protein
MPEKIEKCEHMGRKACTFMKDVQTRRPVSCDGENTFCAGYYTFFAANSHSSLAMEVAPESSRSQKKGAP